VVVGWTDPEGGRRHIGALLLGYFTPEGELVYAGRVGTGMTQDELRRLLERLKPLALRKMPFRIPPPRSNRFGSPLELSRVHWAKPEMVVTSQRIFVIREFSENWWNLALVQGFNAGPQKELQ
jgi:ATP-dependent DNA ligase